MKLVCVVAVFACSNAPAPSEDAAVDAVRTADVVPCASVASWQVLYACRTPSEGDSVCVSVTVDSSGVITAVMADATDPEPADVVECARAMLLGHCDPSVPASMVVCAYGV